MAFAALVGGLIVAAGFGLWVTTASRSVSQAPVMRATIPIHATAPLDTGLFVRAIDVSPDGHWLVYDAAPPGSPSQLYLRRLDQLEGQLIPGTEGARGPFFSPDSQWVAFAAGGELKKVSVNGGAALTITDVQDFRGGSWGTDDVIVLAPSFIVGLARVSANDGRQEVLTFPNPDDHEKSHRFPEILPGGQAVLFTIGTTDITSFNDAKIAVLSLEDGTWKVVLEGGSQARYSPTGHIVYAHAGSLFAVPFDTDQLEVTGSPFPVAEDVWMASGYGTAAFSFSRAGLLVYRAGGEQGGSTRLVWMDRNGAMAPVEGSRAGLYAPRLSPSGRQLVASMQGANDTGWVLDLERGTLTRLTFAEGDVRRPIWTPDATRLVYGSTGRRGLISVPMDTTEQEEMLLETEYDVFPSSWSPDGEVLIFQENHPDTGWDIWLLPLMGDAEPRPFVRSSFLEGGARFSPDGRWVAYSSNESGQTEVYVQPYPGPGRKLLISVDGGTAPVWSRDGRELFFLDGNRMLAASLEYTPTLVSSVPRVLFTDDSLGQFRFDVTADGQRFVMTYPELEAPATQIHIVQNWFQELERLVPTP